MARFPYNPLPHCTCSAWIIKKKKPQWQWIVYGSMALNSKQIVIRRTTLTRARPPSNYKKTSVPLHETTAGISLLWMPNTALLCFSSVEIPEEDSSDTLIDLANTFLDLANAPQHLRVNSSKFTSTFCKELFQAQSFLFVQAIWHIPLQNKISMNSLLRRSQS